MLTAYAKIPTKLLIAERFVAALHFTDNKHALQDKKVVLPSWTQGDLSSVTIRRHSHKNSELSPNDKALVAVVYIGSNVVHTLRSQAQGYSGVR